MTVKVSLYHISDPEQELQNLGCERPGIALMAPKARLYTFKLRHVPIRAALILKQEALSLGAEAALPREVITLEPEQVDVLLMGTERQLDKLCSKLKLQQFNLDETGKQIKQIMRNARRSFQGLKLGAHTLPLGQRTLIMGILNVTPDSFSDGGRFNSLEKAVEHARRMVDEGADIIDIGGESTRPGYEPIPVEEELARVMPVITALKQDRKLNVPLSIDTYKAAVARAALDLGVEMVNDIWGLKKDSKMASVVAEYNAAVCLMHNRESTDYDDLMPDIFHELSESIKLARDAGIESDRIIIDPGIGFGKTLQQNLEVMHRLKDLRGLGCPILLGTSRKSMIGKTLNLPVDDRLEGTAATIAYGIAAGVDLVRVHDVREMSRVVEMTDAIVRRH